MVPYGQTRTDELKVGMKNPRLIATALISTFYLIFAGSACIPSNAPVQDAEQTAGSAENALQEFTFTIEPAEGTTQIALRTNLRITFNQAMDAATLTTHTSTVCSGSVQLSRDNFISCAAMQASAPQMSQGNTVAEFTPIDGMAGAFNHKVRLTTEIRATNGAALNKRTRRPMALHPIIFRNAELIVRQTALHAVVRQAQKQNWERIVLNLGICV
jgi:hypothetical protein